MRKTKKELSDFSLRLKESRKNLYTQKELSEVSNVPLKTIERLENIKKGDSVSPLALNLLWLSQALDVTPEYLLLGEDCMTIYMSSIEIELKNFSIDDIHFYHNQKLTDKVLAHLKLTDSFIDNIHEYWNANTLKCYRPYVQDTIIRYCHNRPKAKSKQTN